MLLILALFTTLMLVDCAFTEILEIVAPASLVATESLGFTLENRIILTIVYTVLSLILCRFGGERVKILLVVLTGTLVVFVAYVGILHFSMILSAL